MNRSNHGDQTTHQSTDVVIRLAGEADLPRLADIEVSAGEQFRDVAMPEIADDGPPTQDFYLEVLHAGTLWVAEVEGRPVAYGAATVLDGHAHIEQVSVRQEFARRRIGQAIISRITQWAMDSGYRRETLITFVDVPWNEPYYRAIGFERVSDADIGPELAAAFAAEKLTDLRHWRRVCLEKRF